MSSSNRCRPLLRDSVLSFRVFVVNVSRDQGRQTGACDHAGATETSTNHASYSAADVEDIWTPWRDKCFEVKVSVHSERGRSRIKLTGPAATWWRCKQKTLIGGRAKTQMSFGARRRLHGFATCQRASNKSRPTTHARYPHAPYPPSTSLLCVLALISSVCAGTDTLCVFCSSQWPLPLPSPPPTPTAVSDGASRTTLPSGRRTSARRPNRTRATVSTTTRTSSTVRLA